MVLPSKLLTEDHFQGLGGLLWLDFSVMEGLLVTSYCEIYSTVRQVLRMKRAVGGRLPMCGRLTRELHLLTILSRATTQP
jgi:hypothetical protein